MLISVKYGDVGHRCPDREKKGELVPNYPHSFKF